MGIVAQNPSGVFTWRSSI